MPQKNAKLHKAKKEKKNEWYTMFEDIENEVQYYWDQLKGKKIWCNCDDPEWSNFCVYFTAIAKRNNLDVKFTSYRILPKNLDDYEQKTLDTPILKQEGGKGIFVETDIVYVDKDGYCEGDFRAEPQKELWEWADVIITNPPFALLREFVDYIFKYQKQFLIIGNLPALGNKEIAKLVINKKLWLGVNTPTKFLIPENKIKHFGNICWWTNLKTPKLDIELTLTASYEKKDYLYQKADNMDVLYVKEVKEIPYDYFGPMSVPISFLSHYNPNQFEILGTNRFYVKGFEKSFDMKLNGKDAYQGRWIIQRKIPKGENHEN